MPMNKFFTLNYLISSYRAGKGKTTQHSNKDFEDCAVDFNQIGFDPSQSSIDAILSFASQCEVLHSRNTGKIELNLN